METPIANHDLNKGGTNSLSMAQAIRKFGGRPLESPSFYSILAWIASLSAHGIVAGLVIAAAATAVEFARKPVVPPTLVLDFERPVYAPTVDLVAESLASGATDFRHAAKLPSTSEASDTSLTQSQTLKSSAEQALIAVRQLQAPRSLAAYEFGKFSDNPTSVTINFAGLKASNARRVVYVVDASGSLVGTFPLIIEELRKSLRRLDPRQSFGVIFFQRGEAITVPPGGNLQSATPERVSETMKWIESKMIPSGRSNPIVAFEAAMAMHPEIIFLLSSDITGAGEFEMSELALLAALERLNPVDSATGRRLTRVQCIQFLDPDPLGTLQRIAKDHGGENGFINITRQDLGLDNR
ncbi:MAG: hypothetical protein EXS12_04325 [Phycisphaerales bacterium]|nr:hypothetical protein [Phycisphaerales bacterium]